MGPLDLQDSYFEHRKELADAMDNSKDIIIKVSKKNLELLQIDIMIHLKTIC